MKPRKTFASFFDSLLVYLAVLAAILLIFILLSITVAVAMRYIFNHPIIWVIEISGYCLLFITLLGTGWVLRRESHVKMDIVLIRLNLRNQALLNMITSSICAIMCLIVFWYSMQATLDFFQLDYHTPTILNLPQGPILSVIPFGMFILFIQFVRRAYGFRKTWKASKDDR